MTEAKYKVYSDDIFIVWFYSHDAYEAFRQYIDFFGFVGDDSLPEEGVYVVLDCGLPIETVVNEMARLTNGRIVR